MRQLLPVARDDVDLYAAYAYPPGRAWLRANMVSSADGAATLDGLSGGLASPADKRVFSVLRGLCDVVLVGAGTVRAEGYGPPRPKPDRHDARRAAGQLPAPALAVVSRSLDLDPESPLFAQATVRPLILTTESSPVARRKALSERADVVLAGATTVDASLAVDALSERGYSRMLCEGGPAFLAELAVAGHLDELCLTISPVLVGGTAPRILHGGEVSSLHASLTLGHLLEEDGSMFARYEVIR